MIGYCATCDDDVNYFRETRHESMPIRGIKIEADIILLVCPICGETQPDPDNDPMIPFYDVYRLFCK